MVKMQCSINQLCRGEVVKHADSKRGVVCSYPAHVTIKTPLARKATRNYFINPTFLQKTNSPVSGFCYPRNGICDAFEQTMFHRSEELVARHSPNMKRRITAEHTAVNRNHRCRYAHHPVSCDRHLDTNLIALFWPIPGVPYSGERWTETSRETQLCFRFSLRSCSSKSLLELNDSESVSRCFLFSGIRF